jgi:hypothetical protein
MYSKAGVNFKGLSRKPKSKKKAKSKKKKK